MAGKTVTYSRLELLDLARRPDPDRDVARAALARLRPGTKARFYAELRDPAWIGLLADAGMFAAPPAAARDGDTVRFPDWPEGLVLLAFADGAPEAVARTAAQVPSSDNARVAQLLAHIAAALPAELVVEHGLARRVAQDLNGQARLFDVAEPAGTVARNLAGSDAYAGRSTSSRRCCASRCSHVLGRVDRGSDDPCPRLNSGPGASRGCMWMRVCVERKHWLEDNVCAKVPRCDGRKRRYAGNRPG